jgi:hypothetical protein
VIPFKYCNKNYKAIVLIHLHLCLFNRFLQTVERAQSSLAWDALQGSL